MQITYTYLFLCIFIILLNHILKRIIISMEQSLKVYQEYQTADKLQELVPL